MRVYVLLKLNKFLKNQMGKRIKTHSSLNTITHYNKLTRIRRNETITYHA